MRDYSPLCRRGGLINHLVHLLLTKIAFQASPFPMTATQLKMGVRAWHEDLLEYIIANPRASGPEVASHFNVSESWLSIVKNSDAFRELWAQRRSEHFSRVSSTIVQKVEALADITVDALTDKIEADKRSGNLQYQTLKEVSEMALKSLGFGNKGVSPSATASHSVNVSVGIMVDKDVLARAREARARLASSPSLLIEGNEINGEKV